MIAVFVNCLAVIAGTLVGLLGRKKITADLSDIVSSGAGVVTLVIGIQMALGYKSIIVLALALICGGIAGSLIDIDGKILALGHILSKKFQKSEESKDEVRHADTQDTNAPIGSTAQGSTQSTVLTKQNFAYAFLNASVLFCVGAMAIIGSFKAGIEHDYTIIFTKSILDGFLAIVFGAAMGVGTLFSALTVFVYQGLLTLASAWISPLISESMMTEISSIGGALLIMIGINLLKIRTLKTANYLPAIVFAPLFTAIVELF